MHPPSSLTGGWNRGTLSGKARPSGRCSGRVAIFLAGEAARPYCFCPSVHVFHATAWLVNTSVYALVASAPVNPKATRMLIQRILEEGPFSMRQLAEESGLSYDALRSWAADRRTPQPGSLQQLERALRRRGERLSTLADQLQQAAGEE
jgi:hypothetical protein